MQTLMVESELFPLNHLSITDLQTAVGSTVHIESVSQGRVIVEEKRLVGVIPEVGVDLYFGGNATDHRPFVQWSAIREISMGSKVLFRNPNIKPDFNPKNYNEIEALQNMSFGRGAAQRIATKVNGDVVRELPQLLRTIARR